MKVRTGNASGIVSDVQFDRATKLRGRGVRVAEPDELEGCALRLPRKDVALEAPLAEANDRSVAAAASTLTELFPSLPLARFSQATDATSLVVGRSAPEVLDRIQPESLVDRVFQQLNFAPMSQIRLVRDREQRSLDDVIVEHRGSYAGGRQRMRITALASALDEGFTMVLDGIEMRNGPSVQLAELFERLFACPVNINGYLSTRTYTSFGAHWDDQEVVILQLLGRKRWSVEQPVALSPMKTCHGEKTSGIVAWAGEVAPGDALYVPRGWGHTVSGLDDLTYHYTITMPRLHGVTVLERALHAASTERTRNPGIINPMAPYRSDSLPENPFDPNPDESMSHAMAQTRYLMATRATQSVASALGRRDGTCIRSTGPGGWVVGPSLDAELMIGMANRVLAIERDLVEDVAAVTDGMLHGPGALSSDLRSALLDAGVLEWAEPEDRW